jgi:oxygen-independent coproporphyrinogen-3 oxidase
LKPQLPPLSLYIHIPWCVRKCPYCDFNSHGIGQLDPPEDAYIEAVKTDLELSAPQAQGRKLQSIFFGGGTPSLFSDRAIGRLLEAADQSIGIEKSAEITLEANPGTFEQKKFAGFRQAGVNRLSIGIQSFAGENLESLGRIHNAEEALGSVSIARRAGFDNINLDLMFGLPNQDLAQAMEDLEQAIQLHPEHISWYELTIEPNTEFYNKPPAQPDNDELADISAAGIALLENRGYQRYETSAFAERGMESRHNLNYWRFGDYLGVGAGAHGKYTNAYTGEIIRESKTRLPRHYMDRIGSYVAKSEPVLEQDLLGEYMMNALRLINGVSLEEAAMYTGLGVDQIKSACQIGIQRELVVLDENLLRPTEQGQRLLNLCLQSFL